MNNHVDSKGKGTDGGSHPAAERMSTTARDGGDDTQTRKRKTRTASAEHDRHPRTARAGRSGRHTGDWQAGPVPRRSDEVRGLVVQTEIVPLSGGSAVPARVDDDRDIVDTEAQRNPRQRRKRTQQTHMYYILVMTTAGAALQRVRGLETVRDGVGAQASDEVCGTRDECAGVPIQRRHTNKAAGVRENRERLREPINKDRRRRYQDRSDDAGDGGHASERAPHPEQRQDHKLESDARGVSPDHANTTVHRQPTDANGARSESEEQGLGQRQQRQRQRQGRQGQRQGQGCKERIVQESKARRSEKVLQLQQVRPREGRVQKETERPGQRRGVTSGSVATLQWLLPDERHTSTFVIAMLCANSETSCESSSEQVVRSRGAGSIAPAETQQVRPIAAIPSNETYLMMDKCAGARIFPKGFDQSATDSLDGGIRETLDGHRRSGARGCGKEIMFWFERWSQVSGPIQ